MARIAGDGSCAGWNLDLAGLDSFAAGGDGGGGHWPHRQGESSAKRRDDDLTP